MACSNCSSIGCLTAGKKTKSGVKGCSNNGGCQTGGCNKRNSYDWLSSMEIPSVDGFDIVEVRFKNGRKEFFRNVNDLDLLNGQPVILDMNNGYHLGTVSLKGELVRLQMMKKKVKEDDDIPVVLRLASSKDIEKFENTQERNLPTMYRTREIIRDMGLKMKLSDVEFQADNSKATFYYSADDRVDFRELIKVLAAEFKIRVEMKQISLRQEASRLGGIGSCGRELCCATWLTDFRSVSTAAARYQNLSLNPSKLSGQCGRLKCCLNYELETYMDALEDIPHLDAPLKTKKGLAKLQKTDIFKKIMWFGYNDETIWHPIPVSRVQEILDLNKNGKAPENLQQNEIVLAPSASPPSRNRRNAQNRGHQKPKPKTQQADDPNKKKKKKRKPRNRRNKK